MQTIQKVFDESRKAFLIILVTKLELLSNNLLFSFLDFTIYYIILEVEFANYTILRDYRYLPSEFL